MCCDICIFYQFYIFKGSCFTLAKRATFTNFLKPDWHESKGELGNPGLGTCLIVLRSEGAWPLQTLFQNNSLSFFLLLQIANVNQSNAHLNVQLSHEKYTSKEKQNIMILSIFLWILMLMQEPFSKYCLK